MEVIIALPETSETVVLDGTEAQYESDENYHLLEREFSHVPSSWPSIFRVPGELRMVGEALYQPHFISIGPYHHGNHALRCGESHKAAYLDSLISRGLDTRVEDIFDVFTKMVGEISSYYADMMEITDTELVRMMVFDSCFILELLIKYQELKANMTSKDMIFSATWIVTSLRKDLLLLENQVPFNVLDGLYNLFKWPPQTPSLIQLILDFFDPILPKISLSQRTNNIKSKHILDLLRTHMFHPDIGDCPTSQNGALGTYFDALEKVGIGYNPKWECTTSATDLQAAGVIFRQNNSAKSLLEIKFTTDGEFEMPPVSSGEPWAVLFPNLIALEQCRRDYPDIITSYVILVKKLLCSPRDVKLLHEQGIMDGSSRKDEKVVRVIGDLLEGVVVDKFYYDRLCDEVKAYCRRDWNRWRRIIMLNFFENPRLAISFANAAVQLLFALTQVLFNILSYFK